MRMFATGGATAVTYRECVRKVRALIKEDIENRSDENGLRVSALVTALPIIFDVDSTDVLCDVYRDYLPAN